MTAIRTRSQEHLADVSVLAISHKRIIVYGANIL